ncbi:caspase, EACC1-associated type [Streptomyces neyagawaensis]|uniref:caspase, EACC1-associated type n=1 Tax=Streptomyces neyagawaensis TaxID=42238 RepID=UPI0006E37ED2|nr:Hsp70 family protein [Streptomyces neyagawaensis]MCL6731073.1 Hsp70 family protein [Streptomyces neyagawaensis]MDE1686205.1 Hsp70 family protein [Streptomyces neyagawaensis]
MRKSALLVVNQHYADERFSELPGAAADAEQLAAVLGDPAIGEFEVTVVENGTAPQIRKAVQSFFSRAEAQDLLLLHLSCHGRKDLRNRLHFVASDTEWDYLDATGVSSEFVADQLEQSPCRRAVVLLDCCYSGAFAKGMRTRGAPAVDLEEPFSGRGRIVITSSTALQYSHETEKRSRERAEPSIFTAAVVAGLCDGSADLDGDGYVSAEELYTFVHDRVRSRLPSQTPTRTVNNAEGSLYLTRNPGILYMNAPQDPGVSDTLRAAILTGATWQRQGAVHEVERLLGSWRGPVRESALEALTLLVQDRDPQVRAQAESLWHNRGLGELPRQTADASRISRPATTTSNIVGIDFGTTNSAVAIFREGEVQLIPNSHGEVTTPSIVAFTKDGRRLVGKPAKDQAALKPEGVVHRVKLELGTGWTFRHGNRRYSAEEVASWILADLRQSAESYLGEDVNRALITVPAYFNHVQRAALAEAAALAGLETARMVNEPTAAALSYGFGRDANEMIMVFDLGGGTLDVSLLEIGDRVVETLSTSGDSHLGGSDWDRRIVDHLVHECADRHGIRLTGRAALQRLTEAAEQAKIELSQAPTANVLLPYIATSPSGPVHLDVTLTRGQLEQMSKDLLERCELPIRMALKNWYTTYKIENIDHFILVGGATRMPAIATLMRRLAGGREPIRAIIPEGVVIGAALESAVLTGQLRDDLLLDVTSLSLGIETKGGIMTKLIEANTTIPTKRSEIFTTSEDNQSSAQISVFQGEREIAEYNKKLGVLELPLPPAPRGVPQVEVSFDIDANDLVHVAAKDLGTGEEVSLMVDRHSAAHAEQQKTDPRKRLASAYTPMPPPKTGS